MSEEFDILSAALNEAIADTKAKRLPRRTQAVKSSPAKSSTPQNVESIQQKMTGITDSPVSEPS